MPSEEQCWDRVKTSSARSPGRDASDAAGVAAGSPALSRARTTQPSGHPRAGAELNGSRARPGPGGRQDQLQPHPAGLPGRIRRWRMSDRSPSSQFFENTVLN